MIHKPTYISEIEKQIDTWNSDLQKFRVIAELADKDDQITHYQIIEKITDKEKKVVDKLDEIKQCTNVNWEHLATELEECRIQVDNAIEEARKVIN